MVKIESVFLQKITKQKQNLSNTVVYVPLLTVMNKDKIKNKFIEDLLFYITVHKSAPADVW